MKKIVTIISILTLFTTVQFVSAQNYSPDEIQQTMANVLYDIEVAAGLNHQASDAIGALDEEGKLFLYDSIPDKAKFMDSAYQAFELIDAAKQAIEEEPVQEFEPPTSESLSESPTTDPYPPNYPPTYSAAYNIAYTLGLTTSNEDRCDGVGLEIYEDVFYAAERVADVGDAVCTFAGCDPTGIGCAIACGIVESAKLAVLVARVPLDACEKHSSGVDSAEIEAGYENTVGTLTDLATTLSNQDMILENQEEIKENQEELQESQTQILNNQEEIIRLLKTPQGRRPGWNKTIYTQSKSKKKKK